MHVCMFNLHETKLCAFEADQTSPELVRCNVQCHKSEEFCYRLPLACVACARKNTKYWIPPSYFYVMLC